MTKARQFALNVSKFSTLCQLKGDESMNFYITSGTPNFMERLLKKYRSENMIILYGTQETLLLHETNRKTVFQTPRKYEVVHGVNELVQKGYFVINHFPVSDEARPIFEKHFLSRTVDMEKEPGFIAFRLLRPIKSDTYVAISQWVGKHSFEAWKNSKVYSEGLLGLQKQNIFNASSYLTTYTGVQTKKEENE